MSTEQEAIVEWVVSRSTLILDNTEKPYRALTEGAIDAVLYGSGYDDPRAAYEAYEMMRRGRGQASERDFTEPVGTYVIDELRKIINDPRNYEIVRDMLVEILDLGDWRMRAALGEHYLPDASMAEGAL